jgi:hypothetical protein
MKVIKTLAVILLVLILGALVFIFWPKIREYCDRRLAGSADRDSTPDADAAPAAEQS